MQEQLSRRKLIQRAAVATGVPQFARAVEVLFQPETRPFYFAETDHHLSGEFQAFWRRNRNGYLLGLPITEVMHDGDGRKFQYFENARVEENPDTGTLQTGLLAQELLERNKVDIRLNPDTPLINDEFYRKYGGAEFFGNPIFRAQPSGNNDFAQYFQKFVVTRHRSIRVPDRLQNSYDFYIDRDGLPNLLWPGEIEVSPLGRQTAELLGIDTSPVAQDPLSIPYTSTVNDSQKRIEVSIGNQTLTAYEGTQPVFHTLVATGRDLFETPLGTYPVLAKVEVMDYVSPFPQRVNYRVYRVPFNLRLRWEGEFIHGTYWHDSFGRRTSVGCVNANIDDAYWLFEWARVRTPVSIKR